MPFDDEDVDPVHMWRLSQAEILKLSDSELLSHFETGPLSHLNLGSNLTKDQMKALRVCVLENRDLFAINDKRPGKVNTSGFRIDTGDAPPQVYPSRPVMPRMRPIIQKQIDEMLKYGIIEHSTSPWGAAVLLVPKKKLNPDDPPAWRFCLDYRLLNLHTKKDAYSLPRIDDALGSLSGNSYFSALDAASGYWQVPMASEEDREKAAFRTFCGHYQPTRMAFGLVNGPAQFQRMMDTALQGLNFRCALIYLDDVLVFSPTFEQHLKDLTAVLSALRKINIHLKAKKTTLASSDVHYLGHIVSAEGIRPDPSKIKAILEAAPKNRKQIRAWLGLASYYRRYVKKFANIVRPLTSFVNSRKPFKGLTPEMSKAIENIKSVLTTEPVLSHPDFETPFSVHCDASPDAISAVLTQVVNGVEHPVMYALKQSLETTRSQLPSI